MSRKESSEMVDYLLNGVLYSVLGALGLLGNALVVLVLTRPQMRCPFSCLLLMLAACDITNNLCDALLTGLTSILILYSWWSYYINYIRPVLMVCLYPLIKVMQTMSVYLSVLMSVERWVAVCYPLRAKELFTYSRTLWYILLTTLFAFVFNVPRFFELKLITAKDNMYTYTGNKNLFTQLYIEVYLHWIYLVVMFVVPFSLLAVLNTCVVRGVRRAQEQRARLTRVQRSELGLTVLMLVDVLVFSLCNLPTILFGAFQVYLPKYNLDLLYFIENLLITLNCSINFVIYIIFGKNFRREFLKIFDVSKCFMLCL